MPKKNVIKLNAEERQTFEQLVKKGKTSAQQMVWLSGVLPYELCQRAAGKLAFRKYITYN